MQERGSQDRPGRRPVRILRLRMPPSPPGEGMGRGAATPPGTGKAKEEEDALPPVIEPINYPLHHFKCVN